MRLIQDNECIVQGASAHISQRCNLNGSGTHVITQLIGRYHVIEGIIERPEIGVDFFFQVTRKKSQVFPSLHGRTGKNDFFYHFIFQRPDGQSNRRIGFTGTGRPDGKNNVIFIGAGHHFFLVDRPGSHGLSVGTEDQDIIGVPVDKMVYCFSVITSEDLLKIILTDMTISLQELNE